MHASAILKRRIEQELNKENLLYCHFIIVVILASKCTEVPVGSLAEMAGVGPDTISDVLASMECDGFIRQTTEPKDIRIDWVELTQEGRGAINCRRPPQ